MAILPNLSFLSTDITEKYNVDQNTLSRIVKDNPKDTIEVEIGDSKQPDFKPQVKIMRWENEVNFSIRAEEHPSATVEYEGEKIKYVTPEHEVHQYDKPNAGEDGGFEFEWVLPKKPKSNVLTATIQTKGLNFFYQPELTQEEIDSGAERPENVVGSYAVYHKTKGGMNEASGMEYKVGKAFHVYRPHVVDDNGNETWGELFLDEQSGILTISVDSTWLDNAVYPVVVDPTFGYTSEGGSWNHHGSNVAFLSKDAPAESGTVDKITAYCKKLDTNSNIKAVIWLVADGTIISNGVGNTNTITSSTLTWYDMTYSTNPSITASTNYYVGLVVSAGYSGPAYDTGASGIGGYELNSYTTPETLGTILSDTRRCSIYATYTAGGGGGPIVTPTLALLGVGA